LIAGFVIFLLFFFSCAQNSKAAVFQVKKVIDGGTLELTNGEKVCLIGVNVPEGSANTAAGKKTTEFVKKLVESKEVLLEFDSQKKDKNGRLLAYAWYEIVPFSHIKDMLIPNDYQVEAGKWKNKQGYYGTFVFLNATIIKAGYAQPVSTPPNVKYAELFQRLYKEAKENKRGLWK
jgi:micrococcal nuclease